MTLLFLCMITLYAERPLLAVVPFNDASDSSFEGVKKDGESTIVYALMQSLAVNMSPLFRIVEREKLMAIVDEAQLTRDGMIDPDTRIRLGSLAGAKWIMTGTITDLSKQVVNFKGYGIQSSQISVRMGVAYRILNTKTGEWQVDGEVLVSEKYQSNSEQASNDSGWSRILSRKAAKAIYGEIAEKVRNRPLIDIGENQHMYQITCDVKSAHVEIDGFHKGQTPLALAIDQGARTIRVYDEEGRAWESNFDVQADRKLHVKLKKVKN